MGICWAYCVPPIGSPCTVPHCDSRRGVFRVSPTFSRAEVLAPVLWGPWDQVWSFCALPTLTQPALISCVSPRKARP